MKPVTGRPDIVTGPPAPGVMAGTSEPTETQSLVTSDTRPTPLPWTAFGPMNSSEAQPFWNVPVRWIAVVFREPRTAEIDVSVGMWAASLRSDSTVDSQQIE